MEDGSDLEILEVIENPVTIVKLQLSLFDKIKALGKNVPIEKTKFREFVHKEIDGFYDDRILNLVWSKFYYEEQVHVISSDDEVKHKKSKNKNKKIKLNNKKRKLFNGNVDKIEQLRRELLYEKLIEVAMPQVEKKLKKSDRERGKC